MAMFRKWPIHDLVGKLSLVLPGPKATMAPSAVAEARARMGAGALERIFEMGGQKWGHESARKHAWRGLALYGVDGSSLRVADSDENRAHFGGPSGERGESGYPIVRVSALMALRSHILAAAEFGPYSDSEIVLSAALWKAVPDNALVAVDRGFPAAGILVPLARDGRNRHWLTRGKSTTKWKTIKSLGKNEDLVELKVSAQARQYDPSLPETFTARLIRYQKKAFQPQTLLTSMLDQEAFPAKEIVGLYHERWGTWNSGSTRSKPRCSTDWRVSAAAPSSVWNKSSGGFCSRITSSVSRWNAQPRPRRRAHADQLCGCTSNHLRYLVLVRHSLPRSPSSEAEDDARILHTSGATRSPKIPTIPARREDQNEQFFPVKDRSIPVNRTALSLGGAEHKNPVVALAVTQCESTKSVPLEVSRLAVTCQCPASPSSLFTCVGCPVTISLPIPQGLAVEDVALAANNTLYVNDYGTVRRFDGTLGAVSNFGGGTTNVGVGAKVGQVWATNPVTLRNNSTIAGTMATSSTAVLQAGAIVNGVLATSIAQMPSSPKTLSVVFPAAGAGVAP